MSNYVYENNGTYKLILGVCKGEDTVEADAFTTITDIPGNTTITASTYLLAALPLSGIGVITYNSYLETYNEFISDPSFEDALKETLYDFGYDIPIEGETITIQIVNQDINYLIHFI